MEVKEWITIVEAVRLSNRSDKTIRNWIKERKIVAQFSEGLRQWRISKSSLLSFIEFRERN